MTAQVYNEEILHNNVSTLLCHQTSTYVIAMLNILAAVDCSLQHLNKVAILLYIPPY